MDYMEEAVGTMRGNIGDFMGEMVDLKEYLQQILKVPQEMSITRAPAGKGPNL